jgi:membrane-associated protease RseP (regulator of RpoE activity)
MSRTSFAGLVLSCLAAACLIGGCATPKTRGVPIDPVAQAREEALQKRLVIETQGRDQLHVMSVALPILTASTPLCGEKTSPSAGLIVATADDFNEKIREAAREFYGLTERPKVIGVVAGSPAEQAGLRQGDVLTAINDVEVEAGSKATSKYVKLLRAQMSSGDPLRVAVEREGQPIVLAVTPKLSCDYSVLVDPSGEVNAYADGKNVVVTKGMLRFVESDVELSTVIAHELAHNAIHINAQTTNYMLGSFDILAISMASHGVSKTPPPP